MKIRGKSLAVVVSIVVMGLARSASSEQMVCLGVDGENIAIRGLTEEPIVMERDGIPDFVATSMVKSVSTASESKSYNLLLTGVKRDAKKAIASFTVKVDETTYSYPKDACAE